MLDIHKMLLDTANFKDDYEFMVGNDKVKLGDFRQAFFAREKDIDRREAELKANANIVATGQQDLARVYEKMQEQKEEIARRMGELSRLEEAGKKVSPVFEDDYLKPVVEQLKVLDETSKKLLERIEKTEKNQVEIAQKGLERFWQDDFRKLKDELGDAIPEDWDYAKLAGYAWTNGMKKDGAPDLRRAALEISMPKRLEKAKELGVEEGMKKAEEEASRRALVGGSGSGFLPREPIDASKVFDRAKGPILKQAIRAAGQDPTVWNSGTEN